MVYGTEQLANAAENRNLVSEELLRVENPRYMINPIFMEEADEETRLRFVRIA